MSLDLEGFRRRLNEELARIEETLGQASTSAGTVTLDQSSVGRLSRMDALQQEAMARGTMDRLETQRKRVMAALDRIEAGTFGLCCQCDEDLDPERLQNEPSVWCSAWRA